MSRIYKEDAKEVAFLLGGIGTGNVSLGSRGQLRDWEVFNYPGKGKSMPHTFFAIWAQEEGAAPVTKVLESRFQEPYHHPRGYSPATTAGLPRLEHSEFRGEYPFAHVNFKDSDLPVKISMEAYTPFIPLNEDDSSIPGASITYTVHNTSSRPVEVSIAGSLTNAVGGLHTNTYGHQDNTVYGQSVNEYRDESSLRGLHMYSKKYVCDDLQYGNFSLATTNPKVSYKRVWLRGTWFDNLQEFWDDFTSNGQLTDLQYTTASDDHSTDKGSLAVHERLEAGESRKITFLLTWYFPNRIKGWGDRVVPKFPVEGIVKNYYSTLFDSSWSAAAYLTANEYRLREDSLKFRDALYNSTLPEEVIDAVACNITVIRSNTCFRLADGTFLSFEGCNDEHGSCPGNCTHVWNYAQTLAFLFPALEQSMRKTEFLLEMNEEGHMSFRSFKVFENEWARQHIPAVDGQMGSIMRVFREWKLSGDDEFLKQLWPKVQTALRYAFIQWDKDNDSVLDGEQHVTYDIEFYGPNPLCNVMLLGALRAAEEMAKYLVDTLVAEKCKSVFEQSARRMDELLFNGEYYVQLLEDVDRHKYQHGVGCLSDQLLGQQLAHVYGLGYLLPEAHVKKALLSVYQHNFKQDFYKHSNCQRTYVFNDEKGLLLCSWPQGGRPKLPFVYSDEVWTGVEYQVAVHLIYEGFIEEGLSLVRAVRERHDGYRRNPWNEVECGGHYVRAMASWGLLNALSGFQFDMANREISFAPVIHEDNFQSFWSTGQAWGTYSQNTTSAGEHEPELTVLYGDISGIVVNACGRKWTIS
jgi:uncharacterized protein (DUF608 family)